MASTSFRRTSSRRFPAIVQVLLLLLMASSMARSQSGNEIVYVYDELGRLVAVINPLGETATYSYDAVGNVLSITRYNSSVVSIIEFTPNSGSIGTAVTIYGTGFSATPSQNAVTFNGVAATVASASSTQIITSVPTGATTGLITVTTPAGTASSSTSFIIGDTGLPTITEFTPTVGTAGTAVNITGTNFESTPYNNKSKFNLTYSAITSATSTTIATSVPSGTTSGRISVGTPAGTAVSTGDFFVPPSPYSAADVAVTGRMAYGESRTVTLGTANKIALMVFDGVAGQRASIKVTSSTISGSVLTVYSPTGGSIASASANTSGGYLETPILPMTGTYTILIDPNSTYTGTVSFTLYNATDVFGAITINGPSVIVTVAVPGQNAQVTFAGTAGQRVSVGMSSVSIGTSSCCSTYVSIRNADGSNLLAPMDVGTSGAGSSTVVLPATGTYTIVVDPKTSSVGSVTLTLSEEIAEGISINGASLPLAFNRVGQNAQITFTGNAGQQVTLGMNAVSIGTSSCCSTYVSIKNPDGTALLAPMDVGTSGGATNTLMLPVNGTYTISVDPRGASTGNITLTLTDELTGTITIGGPSLTLPLSRPGQNAAISFDGTAGQRVSLGLSGVTVGTSSCCSTYVSIKNPDGSTLLAPIDVGTSGAGTNTVTLPVTGTYKIYIDPRGASTGNITLTLSEELSGTITIGGDALTLSLSRPGQNAAISFDGTAGQRVSLGLSGVTVGTSSCCSTYVSIKNPDGSTLLAPIDVGTSGVGTNTVTLPVTGTYKIFVDPRGASTGNVTLTLSEELSGTIAIGGASLTLSISRAGQNATISFDGATGQRVSLGLTGVTIGTSSCCSTYVSIKKPDGTTLLAPMDVGTSSNGAGTNTMTLPVTGTYKIFVDPRSASTGNITLTLSEDLAPPISINGSPVTLEFRAGQNARLTFDGTAGQRVSLGMSGMTLAPGYCCDIGSVALYKPDGTVLLSPFEFTNGGAGTSSQVLTVNGIYSIVVDPYLGRSGNITLSLSGDLAEPIVINGPPVTLDFNRPGQNARLTFSGTAGQRVSVGLSGMTLAPGYCCDIGSVAFYKPDGTVLLSPFEFTNGGAGTPSQVLPVSGTYSIVIDPYLARTGAMTVTLSEDLAPAITINGPAVNLDFRVGQNSRLTFDGTAGQRVSLGMSGMTLAPGYCCDIGSVAFYKPDGTVLLSPFEFTNGGAGTPSQVLPSSGTYSIVIDPYLARTGAMTVTLSEDLAPAITVNGPAVNLDFRVGQNSRLTFDGTAGQRVSLGMSGMTLAPGYCCDIGSVAFYKPDGTVLLSPFEFTNGGAGTPSQVLPSSGTYSLVIDPYLARTGAMTVTLSEDLAPPITVNGPAVNLDFRPGQNARLTFSGTAGQRVSLGMSGMTLAPGYCCDIGSVAFYKPDGTVLLSPFEFTNGGAGTPSQLLPSSGTYSIVINPYLARTGAMTVTLSEDLAPTITVNDAPLTLQFNRAGLNALVSFSATAGQQVTVRVTNNSMGSVTVKLLKPDGTQLTTSTSSSTNFNLSTQTLSTTGTYKIVIDPNTINTQSHGISVTSP